MGRAAARHPRLDAAARHRHLGLQPACRGRLPPNGILLSPYCAKLIADCADGVLGDATDEAQLLQHFAVDWFSKSAGARALVLGVSEPAQAATCLPAGAGTPSETTPLAHARPINRRQSKPQDTSADFFDASAPSSAFRAGVPRLPCARI